MTSSDLPLLSPTSPHGWQRATRIISITAGVYAIVGGAIALAGWVLDIRRLTDWRDDGISMFPNTALCVSMCGAALLCLISSSKSGWRTVVVHVLTTVVAVIALLTIFELATGIDLGIDRLFPERPWGLQAAMSPMRMGPPASMSLLLLSASIALAMYGVASRRIAAGMATFVLAITSLSLIGYWFGANALFGITRLTGIAWQTSTMLLALGIGVMAAMPDRGILLALGRDDPGGTILRRLIVPIIGIPLLLGWLRVVGQDMGLYDMAFGTAVRTLAEIVLFIMLLWWTATGISIHSQAARQAELALRESEQRYRVIAAAAKDADRRKDEFLATLAHELRNPLAPIGNALQLTKLAGDDPDIQQQARDTIERQFAQMVRLVDDLLDVGRITRNKLELRMQQVELAPVIQQAVETSGALADQFEQSLQMNLPQEPIWVYADSIRLAQVFINLLNNACKFTPVKGNVSISARRQGERVAVSVKDTGIGLEPDQIESIFEMFAQVDQSLERKHGGLGIGLTIAKRLVELHQGEIMVRSDGPGCGSEFVVELPIVVEAGANPVVVSEANSHVVTARRILITDDNRDAATSLALLLRKRGHQVETAFGGKQAIEKAEAWRPEVMLLDLGMPEMSGFDVCRTIRRQTWGQGIRIVALTGWGQEQDRQNTREAGFDAHLVKPIDMTALGDMLAAKA